MKKAKDEREAAENASIAADVAEADNRAQAAADKLAEKRRKMQQDCDKACLCPLSGCIAVHWSRRGVLDTCVHILLPKLSANNHLISTS